MENLKRYHAISSIVSLPVRHVSLIVRSKVRMLYNTETSFLVFCVRELFFLTLNYSLLLSINHMEDNRSSYS